MSLFPDATPQQILGPNPVRWEHDNTRHTLRPSEIIITQPTDHKFPQKLRALI